jgi:hypothetical protein
MRKINTTFMLYLYSLLVLFIFLRCDTSTDPCCPAILTINTESLALTQMNNIGFFVITNSGEDELSWNITSKPSWLEISKFTGKVTNNADTVEISADILQPAGNYAEKIVVDSNGGLKEISITYTVQFTIEVFPGRGAAKIVINDTYSTIISKHGFSDTFITVFDSVGVIIGHIVQYLDEGLGFYLVGNGLTPEQTDSTLRIILEPPYDGVTEGYIGIGSSLTEVQNAFGQPDTIDTVSKFYGYSIGINFYYNSDSTSVVKMEVF